MTKLCRRWAAGLAAGAVLVTWPATVGGQTTATPPSALNDIVATRASKPLLIDGEIDDGEWRAATVVTGFIQYEPQRGERSETRTDALVLYDVGHLYVGFLAWDAEPITAQLTQRDTDLLGDDAVVVVLDTTFDRRSGYYFITNALGTQADGRIADDGRSTESTWDAPWRSAARRTDYDRHNQPFNRDEQSAPLDVQTDRRSVHRLQPQRPRHPRSLATGFESIAGEAAIRVQVLDQERVRKLPQ